MADQPTTPSGSRWEPETDQLPTTDAPVPDADADAARPASPPAAYADLPPALDDAAPDDPAQQRRAQLRGRAVLAGAATALTLVGGLTGFLIGHSTAGNGVNDFRPAGFTGQVPGNGQLGEGQLGEGQLGPPQFGDRDGDHAGGPDGDGGPGSPGSPGGLDGSGGSGGFGGSHSSTDGSGTAANPT